MNNIYVDTIDDSTFTLILHSVIYKFINDVKIKKIFEPY